MQVVIFILTRLIFAGWFFFFCRFSMIHSVKNESQGVASVRKRRMQQCKGTQGRMQTLHPSSETTCNVALFI